ncbi:unnamed protein product [Dibothriocephalus latus]|uniref:Uncharacterized protein n=1 Tax=Dibothriocephalus latus TaxID=60516 RepID=A0A3P6PF93_DIBLA|nr:unnamed protein product [Dibothriocephalus latus]
MPIICWPLSEYRETEFRGAAHEHPYTFVNIPDRNRLDKEPMVQWVGVRDAQTRGRWFEPRAGIGLICLYLFDLGLTEFELSKYSASIRCAGALYLGRRLLLDSGDFTDSSPSHLSSPLSDLEYRETIKRPPLWSLKQAELTGHLEDQRLRRVASIYATALARLQRQFAVSPTGDAARLTVNVPEAAFIKYSNRNYGRVARLSQLMNFRYSRLLEEWSPDC